MHDLPLHRHETVGTEVSIESRKQLLHDAGFDEVFPKSPNGCGVRDFLADVKAKKATKGVPVENPKPVELYDRLYNDCRIRILNSRMIVPLRTNSGLPVFVPGLFKRWTKHLPVDRLVDLGKRVAVLVDFVQPVLQVEKAGWDNGWSLSG